jgi:hypothetical protein
VKVHDGSTWVRMPCGWVQRRRAAIIWLPYFDIFNTLLLRATNSDDAESVAVELEREIVARRPDLAGIVVCAFSFNVARHCMEIGATHNSFPFINDDEMPPEVTLPPAKLPEAEINEQAFFRP